MNCHDIRSLTGPYLDSELDVKTSLEIQHHLAACPECARWLDAERNLASRLDGALRQGEPTPAIWERAEQLVRDRAAAPQCGGAKPVEPATSASLAEPWWRAWLWPNPQFYAGLAAVWGVMLAFHLLTLSGSERAPSALASPSPEVRRVLAEQRREFAQMLGFDATPAAAPAGKVQPPRPQSGHPRPGKEPGQANGPTDISEPSRA